MGVGANVSFLWETEKEDSSNASLLDTQLVPSLHLMLSPKIEVLPFLILGFSKESDPDGISTDGWAADYSQFYLGGGAGLFYHYYTGEIVSLGIGPRLAVFLYLPPSGTSAPAYDSYLDLLVAVGLPAYLDVHVTRRLVLRTGIEIFGVAFEVWKTEQGGVTQSGTSFAIQDYFSGFLGNLQAFVGLHYML
jgi:hypothetical protein